MLSSIENKSAPMTEIVIDIYKQIALKAVKKDFVAPFKAQEIMNSFDDSKHQHQEASSNEFVIDVMRKSDMILHHELMSRRSDFIEKGHAHEITVIKTIFDYCKYFFNPVLKLINSRIEISNSRLQRLSNVKNSSIV